MKIKIAFPYREDVVPPRCRKPRPATFAGEATVEIREIRDHEAPVALVARLAVDATVKEIPYRWFDGKLWTSLRTHNAEPSPRTSRGTDWDYALPDGATAGAPLVSVSLYRSLDDRVPRFTALDGFRGTTNLADEATVRADLDRWAAEGLLIDGVFYRVAPEPGYVVMTFGLGGNHGGTYLCVTDHYNSNIAQDAYFSATALGAAQAYTRETAAGRGDTTAVGVEPSPFLDVLLPEAFTGRAMPPHGKRTPLLLDHQRAAAALLSEPLRSGSTAVLL